MSKPLFDEKTFFGYRVNTRLFWIIFTLMMVFFTSPLAHFPFFLGYGPVTCITIGVLALGINLAVPLLVAHQSWKQREDDGHTVIQFPDSGHNNSDPG